jgi:hypothetical protein
MKGINTHFKQFYGSLRKTLQSNSNILSTHRASVKISVGQKQTRQDQATALCQYFKLTSAGASVALRL